MLNPLASPFVPTQYRDAPYEPCQNDHHTDSERETMDMRTSYDHLVEKIAILTSMFPGSEVPGLVSSYMCLDLKGITERNRVSILSADPSYFHVNFINQLVKNCRYVNDDQGRVPVGMRRRFTSISRRRKKKKKDAKTTTCRLNSKQDSKVSGWVPLGSVPNRANTPTAADVLCVTMERTI